MSVYNYEYNQYPYKKRNLLTTNATYFYRELKKIADKYNFEVLAKVRVADIIEVDNNKTKEYMKYFFKIQSKHVDFVLADINNLNVILVIELDDNTHNNNQAVQKDMFKNNIFYQSGIRILRAYNTFELEKTYVIHLI